MLPQNPFLQLVLPRVRALLIRVEESIWQKVADAKVSFIKDSCGYQREPRFPENSGEEIVLPFA